MDLYLGGVPGKGRLKESPCSASSATNRRAWRGQPGCLPGIVLGPVGPMACLRWIPPSWSGWLGWAWLVGPGGGLPRQLVLRGSWSDRVPDKRVAQAANPRATSASRRALPDPWTPARWTAGGDRGDSSCGVHGPASGPVSAPESTVTGFPSLFFLRRCPYGPGPARTGPVGVLGSPCRTRGEVDGSERRELPTGRGPAGRCRRIDLETSPGGWHAVRRQMGRVQLCTSRCLRRLPPEGFSANLQEAVYGGFLGGDEGNLLHPGPAQARSRPSAQPHGHSGERRPGRIRSIGAITQSRPRMSPVALSTDRSGPGCPCTAALPGIILS